MSSFGVITTGFRAKTLQDVLDEVVSRERASSLGANIDTQADSQLGQLNGIFGDQLAEVWEVGNAVYRARQPDSASGEALDNVAAITGAVRLAASRSTVALRVNIDDGVTLAIGKIVSIGANGEQWQVVAPISNATGENATIQGAFQSVNFGPIAGNPGTIDTIVTPVSGWSAQAAIDNLKAEPFSLVDGDTFFIEIDQAAAQTVTFNTGDFADISNATSQEVIDAIVADISTGISGIDVSGFIRLVSDLDGSGSALRNTGGTAAEALGFSQREFKGFNPSEPAQIISGAAEPYDFDDGQTLTFVVDGGSTQTVTLNTGDFVDIDLATAVETAKVITPALTGAVAYIAGDKVQVESLVVGLNSEIENTGGTANPEIVFPEQAFGGTDGSATVGRDIETDPDFRLRREALLRISGSATVEAIRSAVLNTLNVLQAFVFENDTDVVDGNGLPPHSVEVVVSGADDTEIAQTIFDTKAAGIATHRDPGPNGRTIAIIDSQAISHDINFSRETKIQMFVEVDVTVNGTVFGGGDQSAGEVQVKDSIKSLGDLQVIGENVIIVKFQCAPLDVAGVEDVPVIRIEDTFPPTNTANIILGARDLATFSTADIVVNVTVI